MSPKKTPMGGLLGALENPESAQLAGEILEGLRRLSGQMGGAQPVIDALAQSFALMPNAEARGEYDQLRLELIRYLRSLDDGGSPSGGEKQVELERSPETSAGDLEALSRVLLATSKAPKANG